MPAIAASQISAFFCLEETVLGCFFGFGRSNFMMLSSSIMVPIQAVFPDSMGTVGKDTYFNSGPLVPSFRVCWSMRFIHQGDKN